MAKALPPSLEKLQLTDTGCGDGGLVALAAAFPSLVHLQLLYCGSTPAATSRGWVALAGALPSLPALVELDARNSTGIGSVGAAALAAALPQCPALQVLVLDISDCGLDEQAKAALEAAAASVPVSEERPFGLSILCPSEDEDEDDTDEDEEEDEDDEDDG